MAPWDMPLKKAAIVLNQLGYDRWFQAHGKRIRKDLTKKQEIELKECFELMDTGGSGRISTHDVPLAFSVLGMDVTKREIEDAVRQVCSDKTTMRYPKFRQVILLKSDKLPVDEYAPSDNGKQASAVYMLPFALLAQAYRRKKLIEAVMGGDKALRDRMNYRSKRSFRERKALREVTAENLDKQEKKRAKTSPQRKHPKGPDLPEPALPSHLIENVGSDVTERRLGEKLKGIRKAVLKSNAKSVPPKSKSVGVGQPSPGYKSKILSKAYLKEKLERFRPEVILSAC